MMTFAQASQCALRVAILASGALFAPGCGSDGVGSAGSGGAPSGGASALGGASPGGGGTSGPATGGTSTGGTSTGGTSTNGGATGSGRGGSSLGGSTPSEGGAANGGTSGGRGGTSAGGVAGTMVSGGRASGGGAGKSGAAGSSGAAPSSGCQAPDPLKSGRATLEVLGASREYILRLPDDYDSKLPYKLIFAFHARGGNAAQIAGSGNNDYYGLFSRSGGNAIFVSPEGIDAGWRNENGRDIAFVKAMLSQFNARLCIDQQRIFSTGFSFGGMMSDAIGCAMADVFRAIAPMAGGVPNAEHPYSGCDQVNTHPIAVWMAHGDNDTTVPVADGKAALEIFLKRSQCRTQTSPVSPSPCVAYQGCLADYPITFCQFSGGHTVPSFASAAIWSFFNQF